MRNHILPNLKPTLRLIDIDKQEVRQIVHAIRIVKGPSRTLEYATSVIIRAFNDAVEWGYLKENPAIGAVKVEEYQRREITVLTSEEVGKFLSTVRAQPRGELFVLLYGLIFLAGFRRGEALGVGYDDLDPRRKTVTISGAVQRVQHQGVKRLAPKTKKSRRTVWVPEDLFDALWAYRAKQVEPDATWNRDRLLFVTRNGTPLSPVNLHRHFKAALEAADLPTTVRIHDGRHTCATLLMEGDVNPKIVQEILGHSSVVLTLDTYSHVSGESQRRALNTLSVSLDQLLINSSISEADSDEDADESLFDEE